MANRVPDVSVIVAVYNGMPYVKLTLDSLVRQTIGLERMQVLIVDDGSTDGTPDLIDRMAAEHPSFEVIHQPNSGGPAGPRNLALERVRGRYVFFLDADDYLSNDALQAMVEIADVNGTDVVLARIKGVGGRNAPRSMFTRTVPRTDVFASAVYRTLNPMKLFRTEMVRSLGLVFPVDFPWGEDQPFVAAAYIKGNGISIVADKDYVFWAYREDRSNISTTATTLSDRLPVADYMFDFVAANVSPGPERDGLMSRHFRVELISSAFEGYRVERNPAARKAAFERFRAITREYYNEAIAGGLKPHGRLLLRLVLQGRAEEFAAYLDALACAVSPSVVIEGERVFLDITGFRDPVWDLPDVLFDIGAATRVECEMQPPVLDADGLGIVATCRLGRLTGLVTDVSLVLRPRAGGPDVSVPLGHEAVDDGVSPAVAVSGAIPASLWSSLVPIGTSDLFIRVSAGEIRRERRLVERAPCSPGARVAVSIDVTGSAESGILRTTETGRLSLRVVDGVGAEVQLIEGATGPRVVVTRMPANVFLGPTPVLRLVKSGRALEPPLLQDAADDTAGVLSFDARGLASGGYSLRIAAAGSERDYPLVAIGPGQRLKRTTGRRGFMRVDGSELTVVPEWRFQARRVLGRLRRAWKSILKRTLAS